MDKDVDRRLQLIEGGLTALTGTMEQALAVLRQLLEIATDPGGGELLEVLKRIEAALSAQTTLFKRAFQQSGGPAAATKRSAN